VAGDALTLKQRLPGLEIALGGRSEGARAVSDQDCEERRQHERGEADGNG
jgi:hypothetical protein